jgi:predicted transposase/invertase (TIGR01784 family)
MQKGIEKGLKQGEEKKAIEIAKNLLKANVDLNLISQTTNLSIEQIRNLSINLGLI